MQKPKCQKYSDIGMESPLYNDNEKIKQFIRKDFKSSTEEFRLFLENQYKKSNILYRETIPEFSLSFRIFFFPDSFHKSKAKLKFQKKKRNSKRRLKVYKKRH